MMSPHLVWRSADLWRTRFLRQSASLFSQSVNETGRDQSLEEGGSMRQGMHNENVPLVTPATSKTNKQNTVKHLGQEIKPGNGRLQGLNSADRCCCWAHVTIISSLKDIAFGCPPPAAETAKQKSVAVSRGTRGQRKRKESRETEATLLQLRSSDSAVQHARKKRQPTKNLMQT